MNKLYHKLELQKWRSLLELIDEYEVEKVLWHIRKKENKELPKDFAKELISLDISPDIGKVAIKDKTDIGIKKVLIELEELEFSELYQKLDTLKELDVTMMAYLPSRVYTPVLKSEGHLTHSRDYYRQRKGKIISSDRSIITDGKTYRKDDFTEIRNYNFVVYKQTNNYIRDERVLFAHAIIDNFSFDNERLYEHISSTVRTRK